MSIFLYQATIYDVPKTVTHAINKILFPFVWGKKTEPLAGASVTQPVQEGGLGVINVAHKVSSLRTTWLRRLLGNIISHTWNLFFQYHITKTFGDTVDSFFSLTAFPAYLVRRLLLRLYGPNVDFIEGVPRSGYLDGPEAIVPSSSVV